MIEALRVVYRNDAEAKRQNLSPGKRLKLHRIKSQQTMDRLRRWLDKQFDEHLVEPNSDLGKAISYMLKHWDALTLFLRKAGAPLDNNIVERALKRAILHRKNSYFYRTDHGARVGDIYMSLIHTCELCGENPLQYLEALMKNSGRVQEEPDKWLPWNFCRPAEEMAADTSAANGE